MNACSSHEHHGQGAEGIKIRKHSQHKHKPHAEHTQLISRRLSCSRLNTLSLVRSIKARSFILAGVRVAPLPPVARDARHERLDSCTRRDVLLLRISRAFGTRTASNPSVERIGAECRRGFSHKNDATKRTRVDGAVTYIALETRFDIDDISSYLHTAGASQRVCVYILHAHATRRRAATITQLAAHARVRIT